MDEKELKDIEEIGEIAEWTKLECPQGFDVECWECYYEKRYCEHWKNCKYLHNVQGYRKEEEVQKETARKIFAELRSHCMTSETENCYGEVVIPKSYTWWEDDLNKLEKQFGVEVKL